MSDPIAAGTVLDGKYRIVRTAGEGGMGQVYEVVHEITKHRRALKLLRGELAENERVVGRFLQEASAAGRVDNPHIVETFDAGHLSSGEPYLLMELLEGATLNGWIDESGASWGELLEVIEQACGGLHAAHDSGIVHRDLKPDNLFVTQRDGHPFVKILDFGVSKFAEQLTRHARTETGAIVGTPQYMAPEQFDDGEVDPRSDVFALGVILYECSTGQNPWTGDTFAKLMRQILLEDPAPPRQRAPWLPSGFDALVARALAKDRAERFESALDLADALAQLRRDTLPETLRRPLAAGDVAHAPTELSVPPMASVDALGPTVLSDFPPDPGASAADDAIPMRTTNGATRVLLIGAAAAGISAVAYLGMRDPVVVETPPSATVAASPPAPSASIPSATPEPTAPPSSSARASDTARPKPPPIRTTATPAISGPGNDIVTGALPPSPPPATPPH